MNSQINELINRSSGWYNGYGKHSDIVISSRLRIARNLEGYHFPHWCNERDLRSIEQIIIQGLKKSSYFNNFEIFNINEMEEQESQILMERNLISGDFLKNRGRILVLSKKAPFSLIINEEDHVRMQIFACGIELKKAWESLNEMDDIFEDLFHCAFSSKYGYLTSCPTNCGTGLRASIMIHLPSLVFSNKIESALKSAGKVGLVVRGFHGEGSESLGNLYQISNQTCLGRTEEEIIENLTSVGESLVRYEEKSRDIILEKYKYEVEDAIWRSYGILTNCRTITTKESFELLSKLRLGVSLGLIKNISFQHINELYFLIQHAHVIHQLKSDNIIERHALRASIIRSHLLAE